MNITDALEAIEAAPQGNARLEAIKKYDSQELRKIFEYACSPDITFGIKKIPDDDVGGDFTTFASDEEWNKDLVNLLEKLRHRLLTGHASQNAVANFLGTCATDKQIKWTERIIKQDLRINVGAKDVNNAFGEEVIYLFAVPLATDFEKVKEKDLKGKWILEPKLDGGRCVAIIPCGSNQPIRLLSRTGKEWKNFESIRKALEGLREKAAGYKQDIYLDGEVVSVVDGRIDFQSIQKTMMRKDGIEVGELHFVVFDVAEESEWKNPKHTYEARAQWGEWFLGHYNESPRIRFIEHTNIGTATVEALKNWCDLFVKRGYEGAMARRADKPVQNKRSKDLLKIKTFKDDEAQIIGMVEGTGKYVGMLGALVCKTKAGVQFEIGSGFDDLQRRDIWEMREHLPSIVSFKLFEWTNDGVPRFPIFRGFRHPDDM